MKTIMDLVVAVRSLATRYPDAVYNQVGGTCYYNTGTVDEGPNHQQGCLVGQALIYEMGVYDHQILSSEEGVTDVLDSLVEAELLGLSDYDTLDNDITDWLMTVQDKQDRENSWAFAVEAADQLHPIREIV